MKPEEIVRTIYLGDRGIKKIVLNYFDCIVNVQIDQISRIRSSDGLWNYYSNEDIEDGFLTFGGVRSFVLEPPGAVPDDFIWSLNVSENGQPPGMFEAIIRAGGHSPIGEYCEVVIKIIGERFFLEDPKRPGEEIY